MKKNYFRVDNFTWRVFKNIWYVQNECLGKDEIYVDGEGWSEMDFCIDKNEGDDLAYSLLMFIVLIPLVIYLLLSWGKSRYRND